MPGFWIAGVNSLSTGKLFAAIRKGSLFNPIALAVVRWRAGHRYGIRRSDQATLGGFLSMVAFPTLATMTLIGLWHGAELQFLIFGILHACYLIINNAMRISGPSHQVQQTSRWKAGVIRVRNVLLTYLAVIVALIFFRSNSLDYAWAMFGGMLGLHDAATSRPVGVAT